MDTKIKCPYCRSAIPITRKKAVGHEILNDIYCPNCKRSMDITFDEITNLPYLLAYFGISNQSKVSSYGFCSNIPQLTSIRVKKNEEDTKQIAYEIMYHEDSIDASVNTWYEEKVVDYVKCANCNTIISLNKKKKKKDIEGLFCNHCSRLLNHRYSYDFLSNFYDEEQKLLTEETEKEIQTDTINQDHNEQKQEDITMNIISTIIGFVLEENEQYKIYNAENNQLATLGKKEFESLCLGDFPYNKIKSNTLNDGELVQIDDKVYYVSNATKNELFDFSTGKIERAAIETNLVVNTNCYIKYVPILKKHCSLLDVTSRKIDPKISKIIDVIYNSVATGTTNTSTVAKMVRFISDPAYEDILDIETLNDMAIADPQALTIMTQMTNMQLAKNIISNGSIPLSVKETTTENIEPVSDEYSKLVGETDESYKDRITKLMEDAAKNYDFENAAKYQKILKNM